MRRLLLFTLLFLGACTTAQASAPLPQAGTQDHYLAHWEWVQEVCDERTGECEIQPGTEGDQENSFWRCPEGTCTGLIDLRSTPQMARAGGTPEGYGWFTYDGPVDICSLLCATEGMLVAEGLDTRISLTTLTDLVTRLDLTIESRTPRNILTEMLQLRGDPLGETAHKPLTSSEIFLAGECIASFTPWNKRDADPTWQDLAILVKQEIYRAAREESLDRGDEHYKRVLDKMAHDYRMPPETFMPDDLEFEGTLPHRTTIGDTFNRPDNTDLNASDTGKTLNGSPAIWQWTEADLGGDATILNQHISESTSGGGNVAIRAEQPLSSTNHYAQLEVAVKSLSGSVCCKEIGQIVRFSDDAQSYYISQIRWSDGDLSDEGLRIFKKVAGTFTVIGPQEDQGVAVGDVGRLKVNESTLTFAVNTVEEKQLTDSSISTGLKQGAQVNGQQGADRAQGDNFAAADIFTPRVYLNITEQISPTPTADDVERWLLAQEAMSQ